MDVWIIRFLDCKIFRFIRLRNSRSLYFFITLSVIILGIISRKIDQIPLYIGDILYAVMVYSGCRMIFINNNKTTKILLPLLFCYFIEIQQICNVSWLVSIRNTTLGHYALGQGFLWSDLVFYTIGVFLAFIIDFTFIKKQIKITADSQIKNDK